MASKFSQKDGFTRVGPGGLKRTLAQKLIRPVDKIRDLHTKLGGRIYMVTIFRTRWSGGRRGVGEETVVFELEILPTPKLVDMSTLTEVINPTGLDETGQVLVTQISGRFTEDLLLGFDPEGNEPLDSDNVFYEIEFPRLDGRSSVRRRFKIRQAPSYKPYGMEWQVTLKKVDQDRSRRGELR